MSTSQRAWTALALSALLATLWSPRTAYGSDKFSEAVTGGEAHIAFRYRFETVDQDGFPEDAAASTLRGRLNYRSGDYYNLQAFVEFDVVENIGANDYNSGGGTSPDRAGIYPVVADPEVTEVNQSYLQFRAGRTLLRGGRQRINLDNQRFVGGVGWRQNEQTYDALSFKNETFRDTEIFYAYIANVNRIFGDDVPAGDHDNSTHFLNASHTFERVGKLTGYAYLIDDKDDAAFSSNSFGARFVGSNKLAGFPVRYTAEAALQSDAANNPVDYDATYIRLEGAVDIDPVTLKLGFESLEGDAGTPGRAFRTPLATLHAFNGWADKFLSTPDAGLEDLFLGASGDVNGFKWQVIWHNFQAQDGGGDYGDELDASVSRKFMKNYSALLKLANFNSDSSAFQDTTKAWLMLTANY